MTTTMFVAPVQFRNAVALVALAALLTCCKDNSRGSGSGASGSGSAGRAQATLDSALVQDWLLRTCDKGEEGVMEAKVKMAGTRLVPYFWRAFHRGPDSATDQEFLRFTDSSFAHLLLYKSHTDPNHIHFDTITNIGVNATSYRLTEHNDFVFGYKSHALAGLALVGDSTVADSLYSFSTNHLNPFAESAANALVVRSNFP